MRGFAVPAGGAVLASRKYLRRVPRARSWLPGALWRRKHGALIQALVESRSSACKSAVLAPAESNLSGGNSRLGI